MNDELPVETVGASYGDAWLGGIAAGILEPASDWSRIAATVEPDPSNREVYDGSYASFRALYPATKNVVRALSRGSREV